MTDQQDNNTELGLDVDVEAAVTTAASVEALGGEADSLEALKQMYEQAMAELVSGPWQTSYGTANPPTEFDRFLDDAANARVADGMADQAVSNVSPARCPTC